MKTTLEQILVYISDKTLVTNFNIDEVVIKYLNDKSQLEKEYSGKNSILITDDDEILDECQVPFLFYIHEGNYGKSLPNGCYCVEVLEDIDIEYLTRVYQRFYGIPWKILETQRLSIEEISVEDVPKLKELYADKEITLYMEDLFPLEEEIEYTKSYIKNVYAFYGYGMWLMKLNNSGEIIGRVGVETKEGFDGLELGFMLGKKYWHQGFALEGCKAVMAYCSTEFEIKDFRAMVHKNNTASKKLCEKLGFEKYKMEEDYIDYRGKYEEN